MRVTFNPMQLHILEMFNYSKDERAMTDLKKQLADFYAKQVQAEADRLWDEGTLNEESIERMLAEHWRTPYRDA